MRALRALWAAPTAMALLALPLFVGAPAIAAVQPVDPADAVAAGLEKARDFTRMGVDAISANAEFYAGDRSADAYRTVVRAIPLEERTAFRTEWLESRKAAASLKQWAGKADNVLKALEYGADFYEPIRNRDWRELTVQAAGTMSKIAVEVGTKGAIESACLSASAPAGIFAPEVFVACNVVVNRAADRVGDEVEKVVEGQVRKTLQPGAGTAPGAQEVAAAQRRLGGIIDLKVRTGDISTTATDRATAVTDIGVASGDGRAKVDVAIRGPVSTHGEGQANVYTGIGVAKGQNSNVRVRIGGGVTSEGTGRSVVRNEAGIADNGNVQVNVGGDMIAVGKGQSTATSLVGSASEHASADVKIGRDIVAMATGRATASNTVGAAKKGGQSTVNITQGVTAKASGRGKASNDVGIADGGSVRVGLSGSVNAVAEGSGSASNQIGRSKGNTVEVYGGGSVDTIGGSGRNAATSIGQGTSAYVKGSVINKNGTLEIGGACAARRDGQCCIQIHHQLCVLQVVPTHHGHCPPRFERSQALCYLYSDKNHRIN